MYHKGDFSTFLLLELTKTFSTRKIVVMTKGSNCKSQTFLKNSTVFSSEIIDAKQKVLLRIFSNNRLCEEPNAYSLNHLFFFLTVKRFSRWMKKETNLNQRCCWKFIFRWKLSTKQKLVNSQVLLICSGVKFTFTETKQSFFQWL